MDLGEIRETLSAMLATSAAVLAVVVAFGQYRVQRQIAKSDLFSRRFDVYRRVIAYVRALRLWPEVSPDITSSFRLALEEARFLFGQNLVDELAKVEQQGLAVALASEAIHRCPPDEELRYRYEIQEGKAWMEAAEKRLIALFNPYLRLA